MTPAQYTAALDALRLAQQATPAQLGAVCAALRDNGMDALATALIGALPFDDEPKEPGE